MEYHHFLRRDDDVVVPYRRMKPTMRHRVALRPGILGTVYVINDDGVERYFDYDWPGAIAWAGLSAERDVRLSRHPNARSRSSERFWWVLRA